MTILYGVEESGAEICPKHLKQTSCTHDETTLGLVNLSQHFEVTPMAKRAKPAKKTSRPKVNETKKKSIAKGAIPKKATVKKKPATAATKGTAAMVKDILAQLKSKGDEKVRKLNIRNGAGDKQFGVKLGDIRTIAKKIKPNHELAMALWQTENLEAQLITTLLIKSKDLSAAEMEGMVRSVTVVQVFEWLHSYVTKDHADKESLRQKWMTTSHPMAARAGWRLTAGRVAKSPEGIDEVALLDRIEEEMGTADPLIQWTMNMCLAEIGINFPQHRDRAIGIGEKLGVYRDYPCSPGCISPFAPIWIDAMVKRQG